MISKDTFKLSMVKICIAHNEEPPKNETLKIWYEEMKNLTEKQFSIL